jgi:hypothetical protein
MSNTIRGISVKIALAAASGYCCCLVLLRSSDSLLTRTLMGLMFAGGVLFPYLRPDRFLFFRAFGLIVISSISFESATSLGLPVGDWKGYWPGPAALMVASLIGAAIALIGARVLIPLKKSIELLATGLAAALIGGFGFVLVGEQRLCLAFVLWHSLMTLAIYTAGKLTFPFGNEK